MTLKMMRKDSSFIRIQKFSKLSKSNAELKARFNMEHLNRGRDPFKVGSDKLMKKSTVNIEKEPILSYKLDDVKTLKTLKHSYSLEYLQRNKGNPFKVTSSKLL